MVRTQVHSVLRPHLIITSWHPADVDDVVCTDVVEATVLETDVAANHGLAWAHVMADRVRDDARGHGELDGRRVHDTDDVARAWRLEDAEEGPVATVLGVQLDYLLVIVRAL